MSENVCQFNPGDKVMFRLYGTGEAIPGYVTAVDIPTRRLRICYGDDGTQVWQYLEWAWKPDAIDIWCMMHKVDILSGISR